MGDYTKMAAYYDVIMTSGYYDYQKIVDELPLAPDQRSILEIGCGTGLILEEIARRHPEVSLTGVDLTAAMLVIAQERLAPFTNVTLRRQNVVELALARTYEMVFSYGGVWFFIADPGKEPYLASHITDEQSNQVGLARLVEHIAEGGTLCLGVQGPNVDYSTRISNGMTYSQHLERTRHGFTKRYYLRDGAETVMEQTLRLRTYTMAEALQMLAAHGLRERPRAAHEPKFLVFEKS